VNTDNSIGIIGSADGPTSIFVTGNPIKAIFTLVVILVLIIWIVYSIFTKRSCK